MTTLSEQYRHGAIDWETFQHGTAVAVWQYDYRLWAAAPRFTPEDHQRSLAAADDLLATAARLLAAQP